MELARGRRLGHDVALLVLDLSAADGRRTRSGRRGRGRGPSTPLEPLAGIVDQRTRLFDAVIVDEPSRRLVVIAPGVGTDTIDDVRGRLEEIATAHTGRPVRSGSAAYPAEATDLAGLVDRACARLQVRQGVLVGSAR